MFISPGNQLVNRKRFNLLMPRPGIAPSGPVTRVSSGIDSSDFEVGSMSVLLSPNPSGNNRFILGFAGPSNTFGAAAAVTGVQYNGPGGVDLDEIDTQPFYFGSVGSLGVYGLTPGPADIATSIYATFTNSFQTVAGGVCFENVDQINPVSSVSTNSGANGAADFQMGVSVPDFEVGQKGLAIFAMGNTNFTPGSFYEMPDSELFLEEYGLFVWGAVVQVEATAPGPINIQLGLDNPNGNTFSWRAIGFRLNQST